MGHCCYREIVDNIPTIGNVSICPADGQMLWPWANSGIGRVVFARGLITVWYFLRGV